jgi:hypothetical protein
VHGLGTLFSQPPPEVGEQRFMLVPRFKQPQQLCRLIVCNPRQVPAAPKLVVPVQQNVCPPPLIIYDEIRDSGRNQP